LSVEGFLDLEVFWVEEALRGSARDRQWCSVESEFDGQVLDCRARVPCRERLVDGFDVRDEDHVPIKFTEMASVPVGERADGDAAVGQTLRWCALENLAVPQDRPASAAKGFQHGLGVALCCSRSGHGLLLW